MEDINIDKVSKMKNIPATKSDILGLMNVVKDTQVALMQVAILVMELDSDKNQRIQEFLDKLETMHSTSASFLEELDKDTDNPGFSYE